MIVPGLLATLLVSLFGHIPDLSLVAGIFGLVAVSEALAFELYDRSSFSISFTPVLAAALLGGPVATLLATWSVALLRGIVRRSRWDKVLFNGSVFGLFGLAARWVATCGRALQTRSADLPAL